MPIPSPRESPRASHRGQPPTKKQRRLETEQAELKCPICLECPVAFAARAPCGHFLCWVCSYQLFRTPARSVRCPQCRAELEEDQLTSCPATDERAAQLAAETLAEDAEARAEWEQKKKDGAELHARGAAASGAAAPAGSPDKAASAGPSGGAAAAAERQELALGYTYSCAPSGRAICRNPSCAEGRIARGRLRLERGSGGYSHVACHDYNAALAAAYASRKGSSELTVRMTPTIVHPPQGVRLAERSAFTRDVESVKEQLSATSRDCPWWLRVEFAGSIFETEEEVEPGDHLLRSADEAMVHSVRLFENGLGGEAVTECESAVQRLSTAFGETNMHTLHGRLLLANLVAKHGGRLGDSEAMYRDVIVQLKSQLGDNDLETLAAQVDHANVLTQMDRLAEACGLLQSVVAEYDDQLGPVHQDTMDARHCLANLLHELGELQIAKSMFQNLLEQRREIDGEQAHETMGVKMCLANVLMQQGELNASRVLHQEVVSVLASELSNHHPDLMSARNNLATVLQQVGEVTEARKIYEQVITGRTKQLGERHPDTLMAQMNLAILHKEQGEFTEALRLFEWSVTGFVALLGGRHTITLNAQCELYELHVEMDSLEAAKGLGETLGELRRLEAPGRALTGRRDSGSDLSGEAHHRVPQTEGGEPAAAAAGVRAPTAAEAAAAAAAGGEDVDGAEDDEEDDDGQGGPTPEEAAAAYATFEEELPPADPPAAAAALTAAAASAVGSGEGGEQLEANDGALQRSAGGRNMYEAYCASAMGLLKQKQAIAIELSVEANDGSEQLRLQLRMQAAQLRTQALELYTGAVATQEMLHGAEHSYTLKTQARLQALRHGGTEVHRPHPVGADEAHFTG